MRMLLVAFVVSLTGASCASVTNADPAADFIRQTFQVSNFQRATADLNGDGRAEEFVYVTDEAMCGSGGCALFILSPVESGYRVVLRSTVSWTPIWLLETSTHGWRDVGVTVAGGGIEKPYVARLRFDGNGYPSNPTVPPASALSQPSGTVLIDG